MISKKTLISFLNRVITPFVILIIIAKLYNSIVFIFFKNKDIHFLDLSMLLYEILGIIIGFFYIYFFKLNLKFYKKANKKFFLYLFLTLLFSYLYTFITQYRFYNLRPIDFGFSFNSSIFPYLFYFTFVIIDPINEELLFRYIIFDYFIKKNSLIIGIITNSSLFALAHILVYTGYDFIDFIDFFLMGVTFSVIRLRFGWIYSVISHSIINFTGLLFKDKIIDLFILDYFRRNIIFWWIWIVGVLLFLILLLFLYKTKNKIS